MTFTTRSLCFARGRVPEGTQITAYTVPAGHVLLWKDSRVSGASGAAITYSMILGNADLTVEVGIVLEALETNASAGHEWWIALNAGDRILLTVSYAAMDYWLSGALLPYAPGPLPTP